MRGCRLACCSVLLTLWACGSDGGPAAKPWNYASGGGAYGGGSVAQDGDAVDGGLALADGSTASDATAVDTAPPQPDGSSGGSAGTADGSLRGGGDDALAGDSAVADTTGGEASTDAAADGSAWADSAAGDGAGADATAQDIAIVAVCGNGVCESGESPQTCNQDCKLLTTLTSCIAQQCATGYQACLANVACAKAVDCMIVCGSNTSCAHACLGSPGGGSLPQTAALSSCAVASGCLPAPSVCGNGKCESDETATTCAKDCAPPPPPAVCGDGKCEAPETVTSCAKDCAPPPPPVVCGDGKCEAPETATSCAKDCAPPPPPPAVCGNGKCEAGETSVTCAKDCPAKSATEVAACVLSKCGAEVTACDKDAGCKAGLVCLYNCNGSATCAGACLLAMPAASQQIGLAILNCGTKNSCF
jgi:hypothetical protein